MKTTKSPILGGDVYDKVRAFVELGLPAIGTFYFTLSQIWGFPNGEEVVGTVASLAILLGVLVVVSRQRYEAGDAKYDGVMQVMEGEGDADSALYSLDVHTALEELPNQKELRLKIKHPEGKHRGS